MAVPTPRGPAAPKGVIPAEWPAQAADTIVDTIAMVRDRTTKPALIASRGLVYGLIIAIVGTIGVIIFIIGFFRALSYLPGPMWTVYAFFAVVLSVLGLFFLHKANQPTPPEPA